MDQRQLEFAARVYQIFFRDSNIGFWHAYFPHPLDTQQPEDVQIERLFAEPLIDFCSDSFARMYGFSSPDELLETPLLLFVSKEDPKNIETVREFIKAGYNARNLETHEVDRAGDPRWFMKDVASDVTDVHLAGIWGMQQEITHHKRQHEKRIEIRRMLSSKQYLLLQLLVEKYALKEAANVMSVSENTAHKHLARIMKKLDIHNRDMLLQYSRDIGLSQTHMSEKYYVSTNRPYNVPDSVTAR